MNENYQLFKLYENKSFKDLKNTLYNQFYLYIIILMGFTFMSISFMNDMFLAIYEDKHILILGFIIIPIIYFIIKSIYGLILLQESYQTYHALLVREYSLLFIIGYIMIILNFSIDNWIYCYEVMIIFVLSLLLYDFKNIINIGLNIIMISIYSFIVASNFNVSVLLIVVSFIFTLFMLIPLVFYRDDKIESEIKIIESEVDKNPDKLIKDFLNS